MSTTDAVNTAGDLVYQYPELTVLLGPAGGDAPGSVDTFEGVQCQRVVQSAGGSRLDFADLTYGLTDFLINRTQPESFARMGDIRLPDGSDTLLMRGDYVRESIEIAERETLTAQFQLRSYHFGNPVKGYEVWKPRTGTGFVDRIDGPIVFNPTVDDRTLFNMSSKEALVRNGRLWAHPEICLTPASEIAQEQTCEEWTLRLAVEAICEMLNPDEEFIRNPTIADLAVIASAAPQLRNVTIPLGATLPQALDTLLIPHGYNFFVRYDDGTKPKIEVFRIGFGVEKTLKLQAPNEALNLEWSNVNKLRVDNTIGDAFNQVRVYGSPEEVEVTLQLFPAWKEEFDSMTASELDKNSSGYAGNETVHRLWIANEAGDIDPTVTRWGVDPVIPDLAGTASVVETWIPHRRTLGEPLTFIGGDEENSKQRRPILVQYSVDAGETKLTAPDKWSIKLCPDQIGVLFDGDEPPGELIEAGENARVWITGTVFGDKRLEGFAERQTHAVNGRVFEVLIDKPEKFQKRWRQETGDYKSFFAEDPQNAADERDDTDEIQLYAERLRDQNHYAEIDCEFRLPGWHLEYEIGDLITNIEGREISLDAAPSTAPVARFVQIIERRFENTNGPSTVLVVDRGIAPIMEGRWQ